MSSPVIKAVNRIKREPHVRVYGAHFDGDLCLPGGLMMDPSTMVELARVAKLGLFGNTIMLLAQGTGDIRPTTGHTACFPARYGNRNVSSDVEIQQLIEHFAPEGRTRLHVHVGSQADLADLHALAARAQAAICEQKGPRSATVLWVFQDLDRPNAKVHLKDMPVIRSLAN